MTWSGTSVIVSFVLLFHWASPQHILPPGSLPVVLPADSCRDLIQSFREVVELTHHKYLVLEQCVYYHIRRTLASSEHPGSIVLLPPSTDNEFQSIVPVDITRVDIHELHLDVQTNGIMVAGTIQIEWEDPRLTWDESHFKVKTLRLQTERHLWVPPIAPVNNLLMNSLSPMKFKKIEIQNGGNATAIITFRHSALCNHDPFQFPSDILKCQLQFQPRIYEEIIDLNSSKPEITLKKNSGEFLFTKHKSSVYVDEEGTSTVQLELVFRRSAGRVKAQVLLPIAVASVMFLISPLAGSLGDQLVLKMGAMLLQFVSLPLLSGTMVPAGVESQTTKIGNIFFCSLILNSMSVLVTAIVIALLERKKKLELSHVISKIVEFSSRNFGVLFHTESNFPLDSRESSEKNLVESDDSLWANCLMLVHAVLMLFILIVFAISVAIISV